MAEFDNADKHSQNSAFSFEAVYVLECMYCTNRICERGLKSFLIADEKVELFSTDRVNRSMVDMTDEKFRTDRCSCQIQNVACLECGNVVGYHVCMPCRPCLQAQNNGHYWMFYRQSIVPYQRLNVEGTASLVWGDIVNEETGGSFWDYWGECER